MLEDGHLLAAEYKSMIFLMAEKEDELDRGVYDQLSANWSNKT